MGIGNAFLAAMPKGMRSNNELIINKIKITSTIDGEAFGAWVIKPKGADAPHSAILFPHGGGFVFKGGLITTTLPKNTLVAQDQWS